ncbi:hypothetical protein PIB30_086675, partial [Stylosanthes scabra]|nr:hypothetical protein [Stylosanthes scabra]
MSEVCKDVGGEVGQHFSHARNVSKKRRNAEGVITITDRTGEYYAKGKDKRVTIDE